MYHGLRVRGLLPDWWLRRGIRRVLASRLHSQDLGDMEKQKACHLEFIQSLKRSPITRETSAAREQYSGVPTEFYECVLGKRLKYSCGYWPAGTVTLNESEEAMLRITCQRARIEDGQLILDLGCGWGSLALYIAEHYPSCEIVALSDSSTQRDYIESMKAQRGITNVTVVTADVSEFDTELRFDRVVSIEMFEEMLNFEKLLAKIASWMKAESLLFLQVFCHSRFAYHRENCAGAIMPSDDLLLYFQASTSVIEHWRLSGVHYQKSSEAWLLNMAEHRSRILAILSGRYGPKHAPRVFADWRHYFMTCSEVFGYGSGQEWAVSHYLCEKS